MFWIFRRTGAANFFNSLNNNCSTSKGANNNTQDKYVKRPPRKAYGRLHAESDDTTSMKHKIEGAFDNLDTSNLEILTPRGTNENNHNYNKLSQSTVIKHTGDVCSGDDSACSVTDCEGNFVSSDLCELSMTGLCNNLKTNLLSQCQNEVNQNIINRLHTLATSDDDDFDESLTCNVCDRAFHCQRQLASHQQKKRHFGCSGCDSLFPSLMLLEHHKEEFEHWSDNDISRRVCCRRNRADDYFTDTDSFSSEAESEDLERLL